MKKLLIIVIEGCSLEYISKEITPNIYRIARDGFCKCVKASVPTVTNVNHATILSGKFPSEHKVVGNFTYNKESEVQEPLKASGHLKAETLMDYMHKNGASTALLTVNNEVLENFGRNVDFGFSVENPKDILVRYLDMQVPPPVESIEAAIWILEACYKLLKKNSINAVYCATNDYMMHHYAPDSIEARNQMRKIDDWIGKIYDLDHTREMYITGGYGMSNKPHLVNLQAVLKREGYDVICHSPFLEKYEDRDAIQQSGMLFLYSNSEQKQQWEQLVDFLEALPSVEMVSPKEEAVKRFNLPEELIGEYLVFASEGYAFAEFEGENLELESARAHGSLHERAIPLIAVNAGEVPEKYRYSRDIVKILMEPTTTQN